METAKVADLMAKNVITAQRHDTISHVKSVMSNAKIHCLPVVDPDGTPAGVITTADLTRPLTDGAPASSIMSDGAYTIPQYSDVREAARMMRNHKIHHAIVTDEQKIVGVLSSFDLMKLVEEKRWVPKNAPTASKKKQAKGPR